jgi:hypothetical protein
VFHSSNGILPRALNETCVWEYFSDVLHHK